MEKQINNLTDMHNAIADAVLYNDHELMRDVEVQVSDWMMLEDEKGAIEKMIKSIQMIMEEA